MRAVVVYESLWGNTAAVAREIAAGIGPDVPAHSTAEATADALVGVELLVAGAPVQAFSLPTEQIRAGIDSGGDPAPDVSAPTLRSWLEHVLAGNGRSAAFDTKIRWSPGSAANVIDRELTRAGYPPVAEAKHFLVAGKFGPLREGELDRARAWGAALAAAAGQ